VKPGRDNQVAVLLATLMVSLYVVAGQGFVATAQEPSELIVEQVVDDDFPVVQLTVTAPRALIGTDLVDDDFVVVDDDVPRDVRIDRVPSDDLEVVLLVDTSGSMSGAPIAQAREAASVFIDQLPPTTRVAVMGFGWTPAVVEPFTTDLDLARAAVERLGASGETALYDGVSAAVAQFDLTTNAQRRIVLVSDGGDTVSESGLVATNVLLDSSDLQLQVISLVTAESDSSALESLARSGNGRVVEASDPEALTDVFDGVASALVNQYRVSFELDGGGRTIIGIGLDRDGTSATASIEASFAEVAAPATPAPVASEPAASPAEPEVAIAPPPRVTPDTGSSWLLPAGLGASFFGLVVLLAVLFAPGRRQNVLRDWAPAAATSSRAVGRWVRGTPGWVMSAVDSTLSRRGRERRLELTLAQAGIEMRPAEVLLLSTVATLVAVLVGMVFGGIVGGILLGVTAVLVVRTLIKRRAEARKAKFAEQLHGVLQMMAASVRAGYSIAQAVDTVAREAESPARDEFQRVLVEVQLGRDMTDGFAALAERVDNEDFRWVVEAIDISRAVGGDLGEVLDNIASTIRDRDRVRRHVQTLSSEGRLSAWILSALPFVMAGWLAFVNPDYLAQLTDRGNGRALIGCTLILVGIGIVWMQRIARPEF